jgi:hypothetical protein
MSALPGWLNALGRQVSVGRPTREPGGARDAATGPMRPKELRFCLFPLARVQIGIRYGEKA